MTLYFIGLGLDSNKDVSIKGQKIIDKCDKVYIDFYTAQLKSDPEKIRKDIITADRDLVEKDADIILNQAKEMDVAFLVVGDIFSATTHSDLWIRAKQKNIEIKFIHNASIISAVSVTGLQIYKFGKSCSIPFTEENWRPTTPYDIIGQNQKIDAHTLVLLDLNPSGNRFMTVNEAVKYLLDVENDKKKGFFTKDTYCIGCARIGSDKPYIRYDRAENLLGVDFGEPMHCLIVPGKLHFMEEKALELWNP